MYIYILIDYRNENENNDLQTTQQNKNIEIEL
jgi:hypothetical protein